MSSSVHEELEKSCLSRGLSEALEQLMQLIVCDCIIVWLRDITSDHDLLTQLLMSVKLLFFIVCYIIITLNLCISYHKTVNINSFLHWWPDLSLPKYRLMTKMNETHRS